MTDPKPPKQAFVNLWSINRWLRWVGFRVFVAVGAPGPDRPPTRFGVVWYGWEGWKGWRCDD